MSVILCAPASVAALASQHPERHAAVAAALGCTSFSSCQTSLPAALKSKLVQLMRSTGMPSGTHFSREIIVSFIISHTVIFLRFGCDF
jgi:hypothetical protein